MPHEAGETYKAWVSRIKNIYADPSLQYDWKAVGDWLYSTRENSVYKGAFFHLCETVYDGDGHAARNLHDVKCICGEEIPEGLKMICLLTEVL